MIRTARIAAMCLVLSGCGEMAYKVGGGPDQYRAAQKSCLSQGGDEQVYKSCMKAGGWTVVGIDGTVSPTEVAGTSMESEPSPGEASAPPASPAITSPSPAPSTPPQQAASPAPSPPKAAPRKTAPPLDPNEVVTVQSWWKFGPSDFKTDVQTCASKLSGEHRYDEIKKTATRAMVGCMRGKGWRAY